MSNFQRESISSSLLQRMDKDLSMLSRPPFRGLMKQGPMKNVYCTTVDLQDSSMVQNTTCITFLCHVTS